MKNLPVGTDFHTDSLGSYAIIAILDQYIHLMLTHKPLGDLTEILDK